MTSARTSKILFFQHHKSRMKKIEEEIWYLRKQRDKLDTTGFASNFIQVILGLIAFFMGSKDRAGYVKVTKLINLFGKSAGSTLNAIGNIFAFVGYAANGLRALWDLGVTGYRWAHYKSFKKIDQINPHNAAPTLTPSKFILRTAANIVIAAFNIIAVITVIGLFAAGPGLALATVASAIGWVKDAFIPWWYTRKELARAQNEIRALESTKAQNPSDQLNQMHNEALAQYQRLSDESASWRNGMILGAVSVIAFALFATGPFGLTMLATVGAGILAACTIIGFGRQIYHGYQKSKNPTSSENEKKKHFADSEIELRQKKKSQHWLSSTYQIIKNRPKTSEIESKGEEKKPSSPTPSSPPAPYPASAPAYSDDALRDIHAENKADIPKQGIRFSL